jgi:peptidoglycan LD-endopeptidase LytH
LAGTSPFGGQYGEGVRLLGARRHQGWDLYANPGTTTFAIGEGVVQKVTRDSSYGLQVVLKFNDRGRELWAFYAHLEGAFVHEGDHVNEGQVLAVTGSSGNAANVPPHLHFEIRTKAEVGPGLDGRINPGEVLGYHYLNVDLTHPRGDMG